MPFLLLANIEVHWMSIGHHKVPPINPLNQRPKFLQTIETMLVESILISGLKSSQDQECLYNEGGGLMYFLHFNEYF